MKRWADLAMLVGGSSSVVVGVWGLVVVETSHAWMLEQVAVAYEAFELKTAGAEVGEAMGAAEHAFSSGAVTSLIGQIGLANLVVGFVLGVLVAGGVAAGAPPAWRLGRRGVEWWRAGWRS